MFAHSVQAELLSAPVVAAKAPSTDGVASAMAATAGDLADNSSAAGAKQVNTEWPAGRSKDHPPYTHARAAS